LRDLSKNSQSIVCGEIAPRAIRKAAKRLY